MGRLSEVQKRERREGIGSSDIAELLGISPYEGASPLRLFAEKTGLIDDDTDETLEQEVGHALEQGLVSLYEKYSGYKVLVTGEYVESVRHPDLPWAVCNLDGRIADMSAAIEVKIVGIGMAQDWDLAADDGISHYVRVQVAWQSFVAGLDHVHVTALVAGASGFRVFYVPRDPELETIIVNAATRFRRLIETNTAPPIDGTSGAKEYLDLKYPAPPADVKVEAPDDVVEIGEKRINAARAEKRAENAKELYNNMLREALGKAGATVMSAPTWRATYRTNAAGGRTLTVYPLGALKEPRVKQPMTATNQPVIDDGEMF